MLGETIIADILIVSVLALLLSSWVILIYGFFRVQHYRLICILWMMALILIALEWGFRVVYK